nr:MAG TPA: hypothetical protein [Caudoviricetes sp.]
MSAHQQGYLSSVINNRRLSNESLLMLIYL